MTIEKITRLICASVCIVLMPCFAASGEDDEIAIADFEGGDYGGWQVEGDAFGTAPAKGTHPSLKRVCGYEGKGLASSLVNGNDATGKLISPEFVIDRDYLVFAGRVR